VKNQKYSRSERRVGVIISDKRLELENRSVDVSKHDHRKRIVQHPAYNIQDPVEGVRSEPHMLRLCMVLLYGVEKNGPTEQNKY